MANAIKFISVQRGHDVTEYTLSTFGGAGGQHACLVADALGMTRVFAHPFAGVLSAYGMGLADQTAMREQALEIALAPAALATLRDKLAALAAAASGDLLAQGVEPARIEVIERAHLRYEGTDSVIVVPFDTVANMVGQFEAAYKQRYSFLMPDKALIVEAVSVEAIGASGNAAAAPEAFAARPGPLRAAETVRLFSGGAWHDTALFLREDMRPGDVVRGPAIIAEKNATNVIEPGWSAEVTALNHLVLTRIEARRARKAIGTSADPVMLEVFNNLFMSIAEQMGLRLQNTAFSVNIKERLDFSCALVRRRRQPDRQRAAHPGAPRLDGRKHQDRDPRKRRDACSRATSTC